MLTVICETPGVLRTVEAAMPTRNEGDVLLRIRRVGVCGTDLHIFTGNQPFLSYPRVMGHEIAGTVEQAPAGSPLQPGDTVFVMATRLKPKPDRPWTKPAAAAPAMIRRNSDCTFRRSRSRARSCRTGCDRRRRCRRGPRAAST